MIDHAVLTDGFASEIKHVDLGAGPVDLGYLSAVQDLLLDRLVLIFRNQHITPERLVELSNYFGKPVPCLDPRYQLAGYPEIAVVGSLRRPSHQQALFVNGRVEWHYDYAHTEVPSLASFLYGLVVPPVGGDTLYADTRSAYRGLSEAQRATVERLRARFSYADLNELLDRQDRQRDSRSTPSLPAVVHPIVQAHPTTGLRAILLAPDIMTPLDDWTSESVRSLLDHCTSPPYTYRHRWRTRDLVLYDNRSTIHTATPFDSSRYERLLYRTTILPRPSPS